MPQTPSVNFFPSYFRSSSFSHSFFFHAFFFHFCSRCVFTYLFPESNSCSFTEQVNENRLALARLNVIKPQNPIKKKQITKIQCSKCGEILILKDVNELHWIYFSSASDWLEGWKRNF